MTTEEALCVIKCGWRTEDEGRVLQEAWKHIRAVAYQVHQRERIAELEQELKTLKGEQT